MAERTTSSHWARIEERGIYLGLRLMLGVYRLLGRPFFSALLMPVMAYFFMSARTARQASRHFLARVHQMPHGPGALGIAPGSKPGWSASFRHFYEFGQSILDKIAAWTGGIGLEDVTLENEEIFDEAMAAGQGLLLIGSHLGNMEVCRALARRHAGLRLNVLVHTRHSENFSRLMREANPEAEVALIQTTEIGPATAIALQEAVGRGEVVVIAGDRTPESGSGRHGWAPFLGHDAPFPEGPYIMASLLKCPVQLLFCVKVEGRYRISFERFSPLLTLPRARRADILQDCVTRFAARLEHHTLRAPYQWFNFFDFWNQAAKFTPPPERREKRGT